jgi:hypothetical protein
MKIENRDERDWSVANNAVAEEMVKKIPKSATIWRRLISPLPILQEPATYSLLIYASSRSSSSFQTSYSSLSVRASQLKSVLAAPKTTNRPAKNARSLLNALIMG